MFKQSKLLCYWKQSVQPQKEPVNQPKPASRVTPEPVQYASAPVIPVRTVCARLLAVATNPVAAPRACLAPVVTVESPSRTRELRPRAHPTELSPLLLMKRFSTGGISGPTCFQNENARPLSIIYSRNIFENIDLNCASCKINAQHFLCKRALKSL